jgi:hypothetical protein
MNKNGNLPAVEQTLTPEPVGFSRNCLNSSGGSAEPETEVSARQTLFLKHLIWNFLN